MPRYTVQVVLGNLLAADIEAENEDDAITAAINEWITDAAEIISAGTFDVHEVYEP